MIRRNNDNKSFHKKIYTNLKSYYPSSKTADSKHEPRSEPLRNYRDSVQPLVEIKTSDHRKILARYTEIFYMGACSRLAPMLKRLSAASGNGSTGKHPPNHPPKGEVASVRPMGILTKKIPPGSRGGRKLRRVREKSAPFSRRINCLLFRMPSLLGG